MRTPFSKLLAMALAVIMLVGMIPVSAFAAIDYDEGDDDYYKLISQKDWELAPGITESEIVINNEAGTRRQVMHVVEVDIHNPYTKVIPSTYMMADGLENKKYSTQTMDKQAAYAEANGYGNVVAAMNISLSWYDSAYYTQHPELVGEPLGYLVLDGEYYANSQGQTSGAQTVLVINFDEKDGVKRPDSIPKTQIRSSKDAITGWEEQVIPANFGFLVKDGKMVNTKENHTETGAPRSMLGIKADGTIIMVMNDGRQAPFSEGFGSYEMSEAMLKLGCVYAINGDGGGSSQFLSQRPGEDLAIHCSPSDGAPRDTTHGVLVISTAPVTGEFEQAHVTSEEDYYTPGSSVQFSAIGTDLVGTPADIPANATWQLADPTMGTIENGLFVSNGKIGTVTAQLTVDGNVVGEHSVYIVMPDTLTFALANMVVPFGKTVDVGLSATYNNKNVVLKASDVTFTLSDTNIGTISGFNFTAGEEGFAATSSLLTATVGDVSTSTNLSLGKGSEIVYDFEDQDLTGWSIYTNYGNYGPVGPNGKVTDDNGNYWYHGQNERGYISVVDNTTGQVKNGKYALAVECDFTQVFETGYQALNLKFPTIDCTDTVAIGFWLYVPYDARHAQMTFGSRDIDNGMMYELNEGWHYVTGQAKNNTFYYINVSVDDRAPNTNAPYYSHITEPNLNGKYTFYIDDITLDYSSAVDDREAPIFSSPMTIDPTGEKIVAMNGQTVNYNNGSFEVSVVENTTLSNAVGIDAASAKAYIDGKLVDCTFKNGKISVSGVILSDGYHTVKFAIADKMGNESWTAGSIVVAAGKDASIKVVPQDPTADRILIGSLYWMDVVATNIENVDKVEMVFDLNNASSWELEGLTVADGFTATYAIQADDNIATIIIERTGNVAATGEAVLASFPVRTWVARHTTYEGYEHMDPAWLVNYGCVWKTSIELALEKGIVTFVDETEDTFGMETKMVDTELFFTNYTRKNVAGAQAWLDAKRAAKEGYHVHTPEAVADQAPTCTKDGYTGRTYCAVCDSVVDWGTKIPATGHTYEVVGDKLICDCGVASNETGLVTVNGKSYYAFRGSLRKDWLELDDGWYYFDTTTYAAVETLNNGSVTFKFQENGKLISGEWQKTAAGLRYWYGPSYYMGGTSGQYVMTWFNIDGKDYCFDRHGYACTGTRWVMEDTSGRGQCTWYVFDENGACQGRWLHTGLVEWNGNHYYLKDGYSTYGMYLVDGAYYYFYFTNNFAARKNETFNCTYTNGLLPAGTYTFGPDGKMLDKQVYNSGGVLYYYELGNKSAGNGIFTYEGVDYTIEANGKVLYTGYMTDANGESNYYVDGVYTYIPKNGIVEEDGKLYYYENDVKIQKGLVKDENGDYYYFGLKYYAVSNGTFYFPLEKMNGLYPAGGNFQVGADCKVIIPEPKNGIVEEGGKLYYYENDVRVQKGLVKDENGDFYYFGLKYYAVTNGTYEFPTAKLNGLLPKGGLFQVDADGKVIIPEPKNGIVEDNGNLYYYENNERVQKGLVQDENGDYYYFGLKYYAVKNGTFYFPDNKMNGLFPNGGTFTVDANGKVIIP